MSTITERSLLTLELPAVRALLAERSSFTPGRELAHAVAPTSDLSEAERLQDETAAARTMLRAQPSAGIGGARDIRDGSARARAGGARDPVPVKSEMRSTVKGIIHDQSASGQTVFIEPLEILEANNALREAELAEKAEVQRILDELSRRVEKEAEELEAVVSALARLDLAMAKAQLADAQDAERPVLDKDGALDLVAARHPSPVAQGGAVGPAP